MQLPGGGKGYEMLMRRGNRYIFILGLFIFARPAYGFGVKLSETTVLGTLIKELWVNLNDSQVRVTAQIAEGGIGHLESFDRMVAASKPIAAVDGTYFSMRSLRPIGDIVIDGRMMNFGGMGTALCITPDNRCVMVETKWGQHMDWRPYRFVIAAGPCLLVNGLMRLEPQLQGFHDPHLYHPSSHMAVGLVNEHELLFVATLRPIQFGRLADIMRIVGARNAFSLDGGASVALYYGGKTLIRPGRQLSNIILIYNKRRDYRRYISSLVAGG